MKTVALYLVMAMAHGSDAYLTNRNINGVGRVGGFERNPIVKPFVHGQGWCATSNAVGFAVTVGGVEWLRRRGHRKAAGWVIGSDIALHSAGAITSR